MKAIIPLLFVLATTAFATEVPDNCRPNLSQVDMCAHAVEIANELNKGFPHQSSAMSTIVKAAALDATVTIRIEMAITEEGIRRAAESKGVTVNAMKETWRRTVAAGIEETGCSEELYEAFVGLGGIYRYNYYYSDGTLFNVIEQKKCD